MYLVPQFRAEGFRDFGFVRTLAFWFPHEANLSSLFILEPQNELSFSNQCKPRKEHTHVSEISEKSISQFEVGPFRQNSRLYVEFVPSSSSSSSYDHFWALGFKFLEFGELHPGRQPSSGPSEQRTINARCFRERSRLNPKRPAFKKHYYPTSAICAFASHCCRDSRLRALKLTSCPGRAEPRNNLQKNLSSAIPTPY